MSQRVTCEIKKTMLLSNSHGPDKNFSPLADNPCFCNSGNSFELCCGSTKVNRQPPFGVHIIENYLSPELAHELTNFANQRNGDQLMMIDEKQSTPDNIVRVADDRRITERVDLGDRVAQINDIVKEAFVTFADRFFGVTLDWYESPDLMRYRAGGRYVRHADSENMDLQNQTWSKVIDRDLSLLIYLNEDFEGGELTFCNFNYRLRPRAGCAVIFPSDHRYMHEAETVTQGVRYAIVSWASVHNIPKMAENPTYGSVILQQP